MENNIISKIENVIIILGIVVILVLFVIKIIEINSNDSATHIKGDEIEEINDYDEIQIAYNILYKYMTYINNDYYDLMIKLFNNNDILVTKDKFQQLKNKLPEDSLDFDDVIITSQIKNNNDTYTIQYSSKYLGDCEMVYKVDKSNYSFYIKEDSNFGD